MKKNLIRFAAYYVALAVCVAFFLVINGFTVYAEEGERTDYQLRVNRAANCVTVYERDENGEFTVPVRAFVCSTGRAGHQTPLGTYSTSDYYQWRLMVGGVYTQYAVRFNKGMLFHSIPYNTQNAGNLSSKQYNLLGEPASLGCVRLTCADAKWIYDNCKPGTEVIVYDDAENAGPLGKPEQMKFSEKSLTQKWDPTDINDKNPWNSIRPSIYLINDIGDGILYLPIGATQEIIESSIGVKNADGVPYNMGEYNIILYGNYDLNTPGVYTVSVIGIDMIGMRAEQTMILRILE